MTRSGKGLAKLVFSFLGGRPSVAADTDHEFRVASYMRISAWHLAMTPALVGLTTMTDFASGYSASSALHEGPD